MFSRVIWIACLQALMLASSSFASPPDVGYQPDSPLQITRCAVKVSIDRAGDTKSIRYFHQMFLKNVSHRKIVSADFGVIGADGDEPIIDQSVTTVWKSSLKPNVTEVAVFRASGSINRFTQSTPWDLVDKFRCTVLRVRFGDHTLWKDVAAIHLAADASPTGCTFDLPEGGASAMSCDQDSRMNSADVAEYQHIEPTSNGKVAKRPLSSKRAYIAQPQPAAQAAMPSCQRDAKVVGKVNPEYPEAAREQGAAGTVIVKVTLDATGAVISVSVFESSENAALDQAAIDAARATTYEPQIVNCKPVPGVYLFRSDFTGT